MNDADDIAPATTHFLGKGHQTIADDVHGIPQVGIAATGAVPIFPQVGVLPKLLGQKVVLCIGRTDGVVKAIGAVGEVVAENAVVLL